MELTAHEHSTDWQVDGGAIRNDALGISAAPQWFGDGSVFAMTHRPVGQPLGSVVICPPTHAEVGRNQRRELLLAWELAMRGYVVTRIDYRGMGHSAGAAEDLTLDSMIADVRAAASAVDANWFIGTRVGALAAAAAASDRTTNNLVMWEPVDSGAVWFKEVFRASLMGALKRGEKAPTGPALLDSFERAGHLDVVGNTVGWPLYGSLAEQTLAGNLDGFGGEALLVQINRRTGLKPTSQTLIDRLSRNGVTVETLCIQLNEPWWFGASPKDETVVASVGAPEAVGATIEFVTKDRGGT